MRIAVVGAGGVGGYFGGRLIEAGREVFLVARGAHGDAIAAHGLRIESLKGDTLVRPARVTDDPGSLGPVDLVLVAVKNGHLVEALQGIRTLVGPETAILPLLNGVEAPTRLVEALGVRSVLGGFCRVLASIAAPGVIRHSGVEPTILFGELDGRVTPRVERIREVLSGAGISVEVPDDIEVALWEKFLLIATWSGIGAVTRVPIGVWRALPETRAMAEEGLREVLAVARARGIGLREDRVERTLAVWDATPKEGIASMQRDIMDGRPSELDWQSGAVVRLGEEAGVDTPMHRFLHHALLPQERAAREGSH